MLCARLFLFMACFHASVVVVAEGRKVLLGVLEDDVTLHDK